MSKHTPGPWHVKIRRNETLVLDAAGNFVAIVDCDDRVNHADKAQEDAALIAAAPEMVEALLKVRTDLWRTDFTDEQDRRNYILSYLIPALAKAGL